MFRRNKISRFLSPSIALAFIAPTGLIPAAMAQQGIEELEEIIVTGARGRPRTVSDSPVPIDVFSAEDISQISLTDTNDILQTLVPSFNVSKTNFSGGAYIRPATLRGLQSDKTLVLVNSKRRHRSALVDLDGAGAQAADMATIPSIALANIEVLRDGAAAQYGSDAIAGVINFILKENREGGSITVDMGEYGEGDGQSVNVQGNIGLPLGDDGFLSISGEYTDVERTIRAEEYCETWWCADRNNPKYQIFNARNNSSSAYEETALFRTAYESGAPTFGDTGRYSQPWGQPASESLRMFFNAGLDLSETSELYAFGNWSDSESNANFFHRRPVIGLFKESRLADGSTYSPRQLFPAGFTPQLFGDVEDRSLVAGWRGEWATGLTYDFSFRNGESEIEYNLFNTLNASMGIESPTQFHLGNLVNEETQYQADFTYETDSGAVLAFGASFLDEEYNILGGEPNSHQAGTYGVADPHGFCAGDVATAAGAAVISNGSSLNCADSSDPVYYVGQVGANGFPGFPPEFSKSYGRKGTSIYADLSQDVTDTLFVQGAVRAEDYDDFGSEVTWKLAAILNLTDNFAIRGSLGTSLRAPSPGQQGTTNISVRLPNGVPQLRGLFPADSAVAKAIGAQPLKPEMADNITLGFTADIGNVNVTVDLYSIDITDRVFINEDANSVSTDSSAGAAYDRYLALVATGVNNAEQYGQVNYFGNAFDTTTKGVDVVATAPFNWGSGGVTNLSIAMNYTKNDFDSPVSQVSTFLTGEEQADFVNLRPKFRGIATARHEVDRLAVIGRLSYYGDYEKATTGGKLHQEFGGVLYTDLELQYQLNDTVGLSGGARNLLDEYPDVGKTETSFVCCGNLYGFQNNLDWQGRYFYARASMSF
ncbi:MAG: TonB-dependent receptor [Gammaproteobacteria bacterium]|jgi:iron complex outermembrane receptor protein|nr:TonB-dependent receptor [Gammaproteobacteria bacterium]|tara:strand:- start:2665 stop:5304 length:2640 start_codon:yes stop_codon:yes gene_type:complete